MLDNAAKILRASNENVHLRSKINLQESAPARIDFECWWDLFFLFTLFTPASWNASSNDFYPKYRKWLKHWFKFQPSNIDFDSYIANNYFSRPHCMWRIYFSFPCIYNTSLCNWTLETPSDIGEIFLQQQMQFVSVIVGAGF